MPRRVSLILRLEPTHYIKLEETEKKPAKPKFHRDWLSSLVGLAVFAAGVMLLFLTFKLAYQIFEAPPQSALGAAKGQPIDLATAGNSLMSLLLRFGLLLLMAVVGSMISNRGIALYAHAKSKA